MGFSAPALPAYPTQAYSMRPYGEQTILDLMLRQGNIAAQSRAHTADTWGHALANVGAQVGGYLQQKQETQQQNKRDSALDQLMSNWNGDDPDSLTQGAVKILGPQKGLQFAQGVIQTRAMLEKTQQGADGPTLPEFQAQLSAVLAQPDSWRKANYGTQLKMLAPGLKKYAGIDAAQLGDQYTPELDAGLKQLHDQFAPPSTTKPDTMQTDQGIYQWDHKQGKWTPAPGLEGAEIAGKEKVPNLQHVVTAKGIQTFNPATGEMGPVIAQAPLPAKETDPNRVSLSSDALENAAALYRVSNSIPTRFDENDKKRIMNKAAEQNKILGRTAAGMVQQQAAFKADSAALTQMRKMASSAESFENKALGQADIIAGLNKQVDRTQWPLINDALLSGKAKFGDSKTTQFYNAISTFAAEYAKIMEGSTGSAAGSSDAARTAAARLINAGMNKGTVADVLELMKKEMHLTRQGYDATIGHITERMGGATGSGEPQSGGAADSSGWIDLGGGVRIRKK